MKPDLIALLAHALSEVESELSRHSPGWNGLPERCARWREAIGSGDAAMLAQASKGIGAQFHPKAELPLDYELQEEVEALAIRLNSEKPDSYFEAVVQRAARKRAQDEWEAAVSDPESLFPRRLE